MRLTSILLALLLASCSLPLGPSKGGVLTLHWGHSARFVSPSLDHLTIDGAGPDGASFHRSFDARTTSASIEALTSGSWDVTVQVFSRGGSVLQSGTATTRLVPGARASLSLTLTVPEARGDVRWARVGQSVQKNTVFAIGDGDGGQWALYHQVFGDIDVGALANGDRATATGNSTNTGNDAFLVHYDSEGVVTGLTGYALGSAAVVNEMVLDSAGNPWAGLRTKAYDLGGGQSATIATGWIELVVKFDRAGALAAHWEMHTEGINNIPQSLAADNAGNIYLVGTSTGTVPFDVTVGLATKTATKGGMAHVVRFDPQAVPQWTTWAETDASGASVLGYSIAATANRVYVAGYYTGGSVSYNQLLFGSLSSTSSVLGNSQVFMAALGTDGSSLWLKQITHAGLAYGPMLSAAPDGTLRGNWYFQDDTGIDFGNGVVTARPAGESILQTMVSYDAEGQALWATEPVKGASDNVYLLKPAVDDAGNAAVAYTPQYAAAFLDWGNGVTANAGTTGDVGAAVVKYDPQGKALWARLWNGGWIKNIHSDAMGYLNLSVVNFFAADGAKNLTGDVSVASLSDDGNGYTVQLR